jgi:hypothetical protein
MWDHILCKHTALALPEAAKVAFTVNFAAPDPLYRALHVRGETFFVVCRVINGDLYCCVLYVGPQEWAPFCNYRITITKRDGSKYNTVFLPINSYFVDKEALFRNQDCAFFPGMFDGCDYGFRSLVSCEVEIV